MALTGPQQTTLAGMITQEGGLNPFVAEVEALYLANLQATNVATLTPVVVVTVSNWATVNAVAAAGSSASMYSVMAAITAAATAQDATKLGPLFVALYAAVKVNLGI